MSFAYNQSPNPWRGAPDFCPYSKDDNDRITTAVDRVCRADLRVALVPVLAATGCYYNVAVVGCDLTVNVVHLRVDFTPANKCAICERPVSIPDSMKQLFPYVKFGSASLSDSDLAKLYWNPLVLESLALCNRLLDRHSMFVPDVYCYGGRNCFEVSNYPVYNLYELVGRDVRQMLSVVLLEAITRPAIPFAGVIPVELQILDLRAYNQRQYVGVLRAGGSTDINVVYFDGRMKQTKVLFYAGTPSVPLQRIPEIQGFDLISRRLTGEDKDKLMQMPVHAYWVRPTNRIEPVGSSMDSFLSLHGQQAFVFQYDRNSFTTGPSDLVEFDAFACRRIQEGLVHVCCEGGLIETLVPLSVDPPRVGDVLAFFFIRRDCAEVSTGYVELFNQGRVLRVYLADLPQNFTAVFPSITFNNSGVYMYLPGRCEQTLIFDVLRTVWTERIDQLIVVQHPRAVVTGATFKYLVSRPTRSVANVSDATLWRGAKPFPPIAAERVERVIRAMYADTSIGSSLVPVGEVFPSSYVAVVRDGINVRVGVLNGLSDPVMLHPLRSTDLDLPNLVFTNWQSADVTPAITRDLIQLPLFSHWHQVAEMNPHNWFPRAAAFGLGMHSRVGARSPVRVLDAELIAMVARLCR
jgi:hypothetical protein